MAKPYTLTLGPLLYNWSADRWSDFYARIADEAPVDRVCIGEVVCSKRLPFYADRLADAVERLQRGGKQVVLSSLALITLPRERQASAELPLGGEVEINDLTMLAHLRAGERFTVSPLVNVYNEGTLAFLARRGATHICLPPELPLTSVAKLAQAARTLDVTLEVWAFGRVPLALSGRCYHARVHGLSKDSCQFVCGNDPDGLPVGTLDDEPFLAINGTQTLSFAQAAALEDLDSLTRAGVDAFRLSPQDCDMVRVAGLFRDALDGQLSGAAAMESLHRLLPEATFCNGFVAGQAGANYLHGDRSGG